jgi:hypothetical protein
MKPPALYDIIGLAPLPDGNAKLLKNLDRSFVVLPGRKSTYRNFSLAEGAQDDGTV